MKTETTLRAVRNSLLCFFMALGAGFLVACGGGGGGDVSSSNSGTFHASDWVVGLDYTYNGETGKTGEKGTFSFPSNQTIAFSIGQVTLGNFVSGPSDDFVTPTRFGGGTVAINAERLLIALDSDGEENNGTIVLNEASATDATVVWDELIDSNDAATLEIADGVTVRRTILSAMQAEDLLKNTNNCAFSGSFEGTWTETNDDGSTTTGDVALVLLAFNEGTLAISNSLGTVSGANEELDEITGDNPVSGAVYVNLWKRGGNSRTTVSDFGGSHGLLTIDLRAFPVVQTITTADVAGGVITLTVESYNRMTYTSAQETGEYYRVDEEVRNADYRIAGFYADGDEEEGAEVGIYSFSVNKGEGTFTPYYGAFISDGRGGIRSNIREVGYRSPTYGYTGEPGSGTMMTITNTADESDQISMVFTEVSPGYGTYEDSAGAESADIFGGWCAL